MHSLRKHRQQLASCATLWRFFQAAIASVSFPFCCCLFSLYVKPKKKWWKRSERARHNTQLQLPERKIECWEMKLWKIKLFIHNFSQAPRALALQTNFLISKTFLAFLLLSSTIYIKMERRWAAHCLSNVSPSLVQMRCEAAYCTREKEIDSRREKLIFTMGS